MRNLLSASRTMDAEAALLERTGLLVHPGYFFDFEREAFLVLSLLPEPAMFSSATSRLFTEIERLS